MGLGDFLSTSLFANKLTDDHRTPFATLENFCGYRVEFLPPDLEFQIQLLFLINAQIAIALLFGFLIWFSIIHPSQQRRDGKIPLSSLAIGLGLLIPASLVLPFVAFDAIDLRNIPLRFGCFFIPLLIPLKCLDAMFGAKSKDRSLRMASLQHYLYYSFQIMPKYSLKNDEGNDEATTKYRRIVVPCTFQSTMHNWWKFNKWFFVSILYYQIFSPFKFAPFPEKNPDRNPAKDLYPTFELSRLCNNYIQFLAFFLSVLFAFYGVAICNELMGSMQIKENPFEKQPLFLTTSPSDFGRRWNSLIHHNLKEGVYKPFRAAVGWKHPYSKAAATLATFLASALLHEYCWKLLFFRTTKDRAERKECHDCFEPIFGKNLVFFGWCCMWVMIEESLVGKRFSKVFGPTLRKYVPAPVFGALLVLFIGCPIFHLFTECLLYGKYFDQLKLAGPWLVFEKI